MREPHYPPTDTKRVIESFLSGGYDKGVVVEGVARAVKKAASSSSPPSSESPPEGRGNREAVAPEGAISRDGGGRGGRRSPAAATDADARHSYSNGHSSSLSGWRGGSREGYSFSAIYAALLGNIHRKEEEEEVGGGGG